ncbi:hypothetical protein JDV02_009421 [Purpureocillium takamizusanense]|uniref:Uncharacterized protein n=1 Tax=Purpureocillium takamizusanense TaxID=2060973 RepID=A0A9Q8VG96_9HYPO|nr:uncharacterized protein JDV02_009421 [Purpureocillium takamizusanense]UNI23612.1 hypothetical protein JDV02_009421 [Purpureocillium takamizusanense]
MSGTMAERDQPLSETTSPPADGGSVQTTATSPAAAQQQIQPEYSEPSSTTAPPQPPPLEPLFTLLTNTTSNATVHPRVQYVFSDDDPSALSNQGNTLQPAADATGGGSTTGARHRTVVVDLAPSDDNSRWTVAWASSMSPEFAVTGSSIAVPQSSGGGGGGDASDGSSAGAPILHIEGVEGEPVDPRGESLPGSSSGSATVGREDVEGLADEFRRRMGVLRKVVGEGERRREAVAKQQHQEEARRHQEQHQEQQQQREDEQHNSEDAVRGQRATAPRSHGEAPES